MSHVLKMVADYKWCEISICIDVVRTLRSIDLVSCVFNCPIFWQFGKRQGYSPHWLWVEHSNGKNNVKIFSLKQVSLTWCTLKCHRFHNLSSKWQQKISKHWVITVLSVLYALSQLTHKAVSQSRFLIPMKWLKNLEFKKIKWFVHNHTAV